MSVLESDKFEADRQLATNFGNEDVLLPAIVLGDHPSTCSAIRLAPADYSSFTIGELRRLAVSTLALHSLTPRDILRTELYDVSPSQLDLSDPLVRRRFEGFKRSESVVRILPEALLLNPVQRVCEVFDIEELRLGR